MDYVIILLVAAVTFGLCFLVDKGVAKLQQKQVQRHSGKAVRLSKKYGSIGLILVVLGIAAMLYGGTWLIYAAAVLVMLVGAGLAIAYLTHGIYYDADGFLVTSFGKKDVVYSYSAIRGQQLYNSYGQILIELEMDDGSVVQLQSGMTGRYDFMDFAFARWCESKGLSPENCSFHDPANSCWFPTAQED